MVTFLIRSLSCKGLLNLWRHTSVCPSFPPKNQCPQPPEMPVGPSQSVRCSDPRSPWRGLRAAVRVLQAGRCCWTPRCPSCLCPSRASFWRRGAKASLLHGHGSCSTCLCHQLLTIQPHCFGLCSSPRGFQTQALQLHEILRRFQSLSNETYSGKTRQKLPPCPPSLLLQSEGLLWFIHFSPKCELLSHAHTFSLSLCIFRI